MVAVRLTGGGLGFPRTLKATLTLLNVVSMTALTVNDMPETDTSFLVTIVHVRKDHVKICK